MEREREELSDAAFQRIARMVAEAAGIVLPQSKKDMVRSRLARRLRINGCVGFEAYCDALEADSQHPEHGELVSALTTNVTRFMREPHHFEEFERSVIPRLERRINTGGRGRVWSAGCSSGEEPFSIAMTIAKARPALLNADMRILATDIDDKILSAARAARYPQSSAEALKELGLSKFLNLENDCARPRAELLSVVSFKRLNLIGEWPMKGPFEAIFCRNVLIYFSAKTQCEIVRRFVDLLEPGGALFLGHSERVDPSLESKLERSGMTSYRRI